MISTARDHLTYEAIRRNISNYQLEENDRDELPLRTKQTLDELRDEVWNAYRKLYLTQADGSLEEKDVLGLLNRSMSQHGLATVVEDRLKQHDLITPFISHRVVENWPPVFKNKPWPLLSLRDNVFQSDKATKVRLINPSGLRQSIINWIKNRNVVLTSVNSAGEFEKVIADHTTSELELPSIIIFDNNTGILLPSQLPEKNVTTGGETETSPEDEGNEESTPETEEQVGHEQNRLEEVCLAFTIPIKKSTSVFMEMSMNFEETHLKVYFKGKPKKGLSDNPEFSLKNLIEKNGGTIETDQS